MSSLAPNRGRLASLAGIALLIALTVPVRSHAGSCLISGPSLVCGTPITLCGPATAHTQWDWTLPDGSHLSTSCISASAPGTYSLRTFDTINGLWSATCTHPVSGGTPPPCSITGPTSACVGTPIDLCGPTGNFGFRWSGPNGFVDSVACIHVSVAGTYQLTVTDPATGCAAAPCSQTIAFTTCNVPTPSNCPRTARFWRRQCGGEGDDGRLTDSQLSSVASCVNDRASLFAWSNSMLGFRSVMGQKSMSALRARAWRQFAAVEANVCAGSMSMLVGGKSIGLDAATTVALDGGSMTVGNWISATDASLMSLSNQSQHSETVKAAYRRIISAGWNINHGHGMGPVCVAPPTQSVHRPTGPIGTDGAVVAVMTDEDALEPLALELADDMGDTFSIDFVGPNPFSSRTRISYVIASGATQSVMIGVYDINGRLVRDLVHASQQPGAYSIEWDGRDDHGLVSRNGMYFVHGRVGSEPVQTRVTLLR